MRRSTDMDDSTATALFQRLAEGDARALAAIYDRYAGFAYGLALRILRDRLEAEDAVQEAFVQLWRQADRYQPSRGSPAAWLCTIVRTRALDRVRRRASRREQPEPPAVAGDVTDAAAVLTVRKALQALSEDQRRALELAYYEGLTQSEIAHRLGEPLGTVKTRIRAAMMRLREELAR